jgi:hypothetical protein
MPTLQFLRRTIGGITGDLDILVATSNGTTTTFVDALNASVENSHFAARQGIFSGGTAANLARIVRVTSNDKSTTTVTFTPTAASATAIGDTLELYNRDGQGPSVRQIHDAINRCIVFASKGVLAEVLDTATTFDADDPSLDIPAGWRRLTHVEFRNGDESTDDWEEIPSPDWMPGVDRVGYTVRVDGISRARADGYSIRLRGYTAATELTNDADTTLADAEWLVHEASSHLLLMLATSEKVPRERAADYRATAQYLGTRANAFRAKTPTTLRGSTGVVLGGAG